jgi:hypothetical protein
MPRRRGTKRDKSGRLTPEQPSRDVPMRTFIENVPPDEFTECLEASTDPKFQQFLDARCDPGFKHLGFAALCRRLGITLHEMDDLWRNHQLSRGMIRMMTHVPRVLEDVAIDAESRDEVCPRCDGEKVVINDNNVSRPCPVCENTGKVRVPGDRAARDLVFESVGLTGKRGGPPMVAIQQNFGLDSGLEDVLLNTTKLLEDKNSE